MVHSADMFTDGSNDRKKADLPAASAPTLRAEAVRRLEEEIVAGVWPPGTRLDEVQLAERYGLSRTPLREALAQVAASGLIEIRPRSGAFVTKLSPRGILECLAFTGEIEAIAATWAATRMTQAERDELVDLQEQGRLALEGGDPDRYFEENRRFHAAIYAGAHNTYVQETALQLFLRGAPYRRLQLRQRGRLLKSHHEHGMIMNAILAEDGAAAAKAIRAHINIQGDRFLEFLGSLPAAYIGQDAK